MRLVVFYDVCHDQLAHQFSKCISEIERYVFYLLVLTEEWYVAVLARVRINDVRIELAGGSYEDMLASAAALVEAEAAVGNAVYLLPSLYNHDCGKVSHIQAAGCLRFTL